MRTAWGLLALATVALFAWLVFAPAGENRLARKQEPKAPLPEVSVAPPVAPAKRAASPEQEPVKRQMLAHEKAEAERLAALAQQEAAAKAKPEIKLYYRVTVRDGGTLEAGDVIISLDAIKAREADAHCKDASGKAWPCGTAARAALTKLIRGRAVSCTLPQGGEQKAFASRCSVADTDLSSWMVRHGWAEAIAPAEPEIVKAAEDARRERIGFWRAAE
jgi:endonuclease YncB( thermonuclease family)